MKPLFIPLKTEFYEAFKAGTKDTEYRLHGPRWNERTCKPGRAVILSKGYGTRNRMRGYIERFWVDPHPWQRPGFVDCYGCIAGQEGACIKIRLADS